MRKAEDYYVWKAAIFYADDAHKKEDFAIQTRRDENRCHKKLPSKHDYFFNGKYYYNWDV